MKNTFKNTMFVTTTSTFAIKGRDELQKHRINADIKKAQGGTAAGCLFGITVPIAYAAEAEKILQSSGIRIISVRDD